MPLFEYLCSDCGQVSEMLILNKTDVPKCQACQSKNVKKLLSAHSSYTGASGTRLPGHGNTPCCGSSPSEAGCAGPGSCCGKQRG